MNTDDPVPKKVGEYYDQWTPRYRAVFGDTFQACRTTDISDLHRYILEHADVRDGQRILDAGCGVCGPSMFFAQRRDIVIDAITVSREQVAAARHLIAAVQLQDRITVHLGDFHRLHEYFGEATFDRVLFLESLSHAAAPREALRSAFEVLKPGGIIYIKDFFEKECDTDEERGRVRAVIDRVDRTFVLKTPRLQSIVNILAAIGFRPLKIELVSFPIDDAVWRSFNDAHHFDLYDGGEPCQWSDWIELKFEKPPAEEFHELEAVSKH